MPLHRNFQDNFEIHLRRITSAAVELPPTIDELRERLKAFHRDTDGQVMRERLAAAVITADPTADVALLWAASLAEASASPPLVADLREHVRMHTNRAIRAAYSEVAEPIYRALARQFDAAAQVFTAAVAEVDPELHAEQAITLPAKKQTAWKDAAAAVADLNRLAPPLKSAAVLGGICPDTKDADLPLMVDPREANRRTLWAAWETELAVDKAERAAKNGSPFSTAPVSRTRCGRWGAVFRTGAAIRACAPEAFTEYRRPAPMEERAIDGKRVMVDPDAADYEPPQPPRFAPPRRIVVAR